MKITLAVLAVLAIACGPEIEPRIDAITPSSRSSTGGGSVGSIAPPADSTSGSSGTGSTGSAASMGLGSSSGGGSTFGGACTPWGDGGCAIGICETPFQPAPVQGWTCQPGSLGADHCAPLRAVCIDNGSCCNFGSEVHCQNSSCCATTGTACSDAQDCCSGNCGGGSCQ